ncbi:MAG: signal peptidase I [Candidatus Saccharibacteria bacterium]|nr:signal peptidase I [Candidatus Saccharibacteria bacterium]MCY4088902.1 signal peptidase I [Candidatus Saccharibacteria bacterium]
MINLLRKWFRFVGKLNRNQPPLGLIVHVLASLIVILSIFLVVSIVFIDVAQVKGISMEPTLKADNRLIIFKSEGFFYRLINGEYKPQRGDIVIFEKERSEHLIIKRIIGLPNERLVLENQRLTIYNADFPQGFLLDNQKNLTSDFDIDEKFDIQVKRGEVFVIGDNRSFSTDSRIFGNILIENIIGRVIIRIWPVDQMKTF